jgi:hypothetical protein
MEKSMKSDIPDELVYSEMARQISESGCSSVCWENLKGKGGLPNDDHILHAKIRQMIAKRRLRGCDCGCRGDLRFPWQQFGDDPDIENWRDRVAENNAKPVADRPGGY